MPQGYVQACQGHPGRHTATWPSLRPWVWAGSRWTAEECQRAADHPLTQDQVLHSEAAQLFCWAGAGRVWY